MEKVIAVKPLDAFQLELTFNNGERRIFDAHPYLDKGVFGKLKDSALFKQAFVAYSTVCWPGNLDIAPDTLYLRSKPV